MIPQYFFLYLILTALTIVGLFVTGPLQVLPILFVFLGIPLIDLIVGVNQSNPNQENEKKWRETKVWSPALYLYAFTHFLILGLAAKQVHTQNVIILGIIVGMYTGGLGITVAHELCHKKEWLPRFTADLLLASVCYQHFAIEHVRGHHLHVSTPHDPASARLNENVYRFLFRTITGTFMSALEIDRKAVFKGLSLSFLFIILAAFLGQSILIFFLIQSVVAFVLLELVNYVEHYGLSRKQLENGRFEKVLPIHSWNSSHRFSNYLLFNLQRHSDHHALAHLPYTVLKHHPEAPQLPSGYPGMILLALVPPLWFKTMNPKIKSLNLHTPI